MMKKVFTLIEKKNCVIKENLFRSEQLVTMKISNLIQKYINHFWRKKKKNSSINWERHQKAMKKRTSPQTKTDALESVFLFLIIIGLILIGLLLMFIRYDYILRSEEHTSELQSRGH